MTYNLRELGINSEYRAAEFEHELGIRFSDFTSEQIDTWQRQTICLNQYAYTRTYSSAARAAGVTVYTIEAWERDNELGFVRRKEMADREFCDGLEELLLERARMPESPPSLLSAVLRAQMPEKYRGSRYERDPDDGPGYESSGPDTYHKLIADIVRQLQQREDPIDGEESGDKTPVGAGFKPAPDHSDHAPESAALEPASGPSDHASESAGLKPATGPSGRTPVAAGLKPAPGPSDHASESAGLKPATGPSGHTPVTAGINSTPDHADQSPVGEGSKPDPGPSGEDSPTGDKPRHPAPITRNSSNLNRRQRRELQRRIKRNGQNSHRPRAPN